MILVTHSNTLYHLIDMEKKYFLVYYMCPIKGDITTYVRVRQNTS